MGIEAKWPYDQIVGIDEKLTREIVRRLLGVIRAKRIILFGSAATGEMTKDSDIDLLVVADGVGTNVKDYGRLHEALRGLGFAFDVFVIGSQRFEETKDLFGGIAYPAHKYGRVVYEGN